MSSSTGGLNHLIGLIGFGACAFVSAKVYADATFDTIAHKENPDYLLRRVEEWGVQISPRSPEDVSSEERRQFLDNLLYLLKRKSTYTHTECKGLIYHEVMMMRRLVIRQSIPDVFLELPYVYLQLADIYKRRLGYLDSSKSVDPDICEAVESQTKLTTKRMCLAYLLCNGHYWTYLKYAFF